MTRSSSTCLGQMALALQLGVALLVMVTRVGAQGGLTPGICTGYQSAATFDDAYIAKLTSATDGYAVLLTSDRPRTSNCQRLTLYGNGTFLFTYNDDYNRPRNHSDTYDIKRSSFTRPGYIRLRMPAAVFGATLTGDLRLYVLVVADDYFVAASCWEPLPFVRNEYVHVFVPAAKVNTISPTELQTSLVEMGVPSSAQMREVYQGCIADIRLLDTQGKVDFYNFLVKIGLAPPLPFRRVHEIRAGIPAQFYSVPTNFITAHPGYHLAPSAVAPVRSFLNGPSSPVSGTISTSGSGQSFVHNAALPSTTHHLPPTVVSFFHRPPGFVPVSPDVNFDSQGFTISSQDEILPNSPGVGHGEVAALSSSPGIIYNSPVISYTPKGFSSTNLPTFLHNHRVVGGYAFPNSG